MMAAPMGQWPPPADRLHAAGFSSSTDNDGSSSDDDRDRRRYQHSRRGHAHRHGASRAATADTSPLGRALGALAANVIRTHLPAIATRAGHDDRAFLSAAQMLLALALEVLERGACPGGDLAVCSLDMLQAGIAAWLADQERARQAYDRMAGKMSRDTGRDAKYFPDPYAVYPTWWGNAEVSPELPPVPPSAQALVQKWNLHGALAESAARAVDAHDRPVMALPSVTAWTIPKRMVDEFTQTPIESRLPPPPAVPGVPKHMRTGDAGQAAPPPAPARPAAAPAAFFVPVDDTESTKPRRAPPQLSPPRPRRATAPAPAPASAPAKPRTSTNATAAARRSTTTSSPGPTARKPAPNGTKSTPATSVAAPKRPKSVAFTVTAPTLPVASSPRVAELVNVARGALAADFCAAFDDGSDNGSVSDGDGDKGDSNKGNGSRTASPAPSSSPALSTRGMDLRAKPSRTRPATAAAGSQKPGPAESSSTVVTAKDRVWFRKAWAARHGAQVEVDANAEADAGSGTRAAAKGVAWEVPV
ncbi:hypothetical protein AMAG_13833 [Allomyces macrogynus ATCC 38327]|uniref:Uncharacterized protein n=1 Tax=Allomyces macrogynus (strain ATCC 38327) TaxID=578462 RepID=A0A0L0T2P5_ALLM3|nr:hypothetical protein AMAG_13833 [Allomyces macrogynus ATCC 38327]|eukprot:KNE68957.1 hypothetical protein AMAG_13833 [Allomyces macrogynus ATCC 38327]